MQYPVRDYPGKCASPPWITFIDTGEFLNADHYFRLDDHLYLAGHLAVSNALTRAIIHQAESNPD